MKKWMILLAVAGISAGIAGLLEAADLNPQPLPPGTGDNGVQGRSDNQTTDGQISADGQKQISGNLNETNQAKTVNPLSPGNGTHIKKGVLVVRKAGKNASTSGSSVHSISNGSGHGKNLNQPSNVNFDQSLMEEGGVYYYFKHSDGHHQMVNGQSQNGASATGAKVPKVGKEVIVNYEEGDPDKPIVTGQVYNGATPTGGSHFSKAQLQARKAGKEGKTNVKSFGSVAGNSQKPATFTGSTGGNAALGNHSAQPMAR